VVLLLLAIGFVLLPTLNSDYVSYDPGVTIIVIARNEEAYIQKCLQTIIAQNYAKDKMEIILVDDASADNTNTIAVEVLSRSGISSKVIRNEIQLGKKKSIIRAIEESSNSFIITRDADTFSTSYSWLKCITHHYISSKKEFIICPVAVWPSNNLLSALQETEAKVIMVFSAASYYFHAPFLCSGANLAFTKELFYETKAYENHIHIASGDDVLFLEDVKKLKSEKIGYLKSADALVYTYPEKTLNSLLHQKVRWSSKVFKSTNGLNWFLSVLIATTNFLWILALFYLIFNPKTAFLAFFFVISKLLIDILLVFLASRFIKAGINWALLVVVGFIYPFYTLLVAAGAFFVKPKWK
jgi:cellulose synthase/poly-beta-1,6-N-acetylglucosamine synthase-like glycosyltransferase